MTDGFDLQALLAQAQEMQQRMLEAQGAAAEQTVEGSAGGVVTVTATGTGEFTSVRIRPEFVDPTEVDLLEDLILAALHDVAGKVMALNQQSLGQLDLGDLGGLAGLGRSGHEGPDHEGSGHEGPDHEGSGHEGPGGG